MRRVDRSIAMLVALFCLDRLLKVTAVIDFFRRRPPPAPVHWPSVTLLQPITRGVPDLAANLSKRSDRCRRARRARHQSPKVANGQ